MPTNEEVIALISDAIKEARKNIADEILEMQANLNVPGHSDSLYNITMRDISKKVRDGG